jgi:hypothetical protein
MRRRYRGNGPLAWLMFWLMIGAAGVMILSVMVAGVH